MTRAALHRDTAWLRSNPGLGVELFDLLNHRPATAPGAPRTVMVWDPQRPGWRMTVTDPAAEGTPPQQRQGGHTPRGG